MVSVLRPLVAVSLLVCGIAADKTRYRYLAGFIDDKSREKVY
jgi:hypothetical protein